MTEATTGRRLFIRTLNVAFRTMLFAPVTAFAGHGLEGAELIYLFYGPQFLFLLGVSLVVSVGMLPGPLILRWIGGAAGPMVGLWAAFHHEGNPVEFYGFSVVPIAFMLAFALPRLIWAADRPARRIPRPSPAKIPPVSEAWRSGPFVSTLAATLRPGTTVASIIPDEWTRLAEQLRWQRRGDISEQMNHAIVPPQTIAGSAREFSFMAYPWPRKSCNEKDPTRSGKRERLRVTFEDGSVVIDLDDAGQVEWIYVHNVPRLYEPIASGCKG